MKNVVLKVIASFALVSSLSACAVGDQTPESGPMKNFQSLSGTSWWVEDIDGKGVIDMSHTTIEFNEDGKVAGDSGCNRYFGAYKIVAGRDGLNGVSFGPLAGTRRACAAALMNQESDFYRAMERVRHWEIADTGLLYLSDDEGKKLLRAFRTEEE